MTLILSGKELAEKIKAEIRQETAGLVRAPKLCSIVIGDCSSSLKYSQRKEKLFQQLGLGYELKHLSKDDTGLQELIYEINKDATIDGIMIHYPLPDDFDPEEVASMIDPEKDIEGLNPYSHFEPCTAKAVMRLLEEYEIEISWKQAVVIGRSRIVGGPVYEMLLARDATVSVCHSKTSKETLDYLCREAEIIVTATGKPGLITAEMVSAKAVIIDAGTNYVKGKLFGDVDSVIYGKVKALSPVPGGVGPLTNLMAAKNLLAAYRMRKNE